MESTTASTRSPGDAVRETFHALFDERDLSDPGRYWTEESTNYFVALGLTVRGVQPLAQFFRELFTAFPDWNMTVENVVDDGDRKAVVQWRATGTFTGAPLFGVEPNGRPVDMRGCDCFVLDADGKVDTNTVYYDAAEYARQLGMLPRRDSAGDRAMLGAFNAGTRVMRRVRRRG